MERQSGGSTTVDSFPLGALLAGAPTNERWCQLDSLADHSPDEAMVGPHLSRLPLPSLLEGGDFTAVAMHETERRS